MSTTKIWPNWSDPEHIKDYSVPEETASSDEEIRLAFMAIGLSLPAIYSMMGRGLAKRGHLHIVVSLEKEDDEGIPYFLDIAEESLGDPNAWEHDYRGVAHGKRDMVTRTGLSSREVRDNPSLMEDGDPEWAGGVIVDDVIVAASGVEEEFDELFAYWVAHAYVGLRHNSLR